MVLLSIGLASGLEDTADVSALAVALELDLCAINGQPEDESIKVLFNGREVARGETLLLDDVQTEPEVRIVGGHSRAVYTLIMVDPDAPNRYKQ